MVEAGKGLGADAHVVTVHVGIGQRGRMRMEGMGEEEQGEREDVSKGGRLFALLTLCTTMDWAGHSFNDSKI